MTIQIKLPKFFPVGTRVRFNKGPCGVVLEVRAEIMMDIYDLGDGARMRTRNQHTTYHIQFDDGTIKRQVSGLLVELAGADHE